MLENLNDQQKKVLIAILKMIIVADGKINDTELKKINDIAEKKNFSNFQEIFSKVDKEVKSEEDLRNLISTVKDNNAQYDILETAIDMSLADSKIRPSENKIIKMICFEWDINNYAFD